MAESDTDGTPSDEHGSGDAPRVVSLGSVNVDRFHEVTAADRERLATHDWYPASDETRTVDRIPPALADEPVDAVHHGGKGANQAVAAARAGADAAMLGAVGPDADDAGVRDALRRDGVDVDHLATAPVPTGTAHVFRDADGENRILVARGANDHVDDEYVAGVEPAVRDADALLLQNEIPAGPVVNLLDRLTDGDGGGRTERSEQQGGGPRRPTVILDPAPVDGAARLLTEAVDCCTPNEHEYADDRLRSALTDFEGVLARTRGSDPVVVAAPGERFTVTPPAVDVVDTTGAGDVFTGYLATRLAAGDDLRVAVETAVTAASLSTQTAGAREGIPTLSTVRAFHAED